MVDGARDDLIKCFIFQSAFIKQSGMYACACLNRRFDQYLKRSCPTNMPDSLREIKTSANFTFITILINCDYMKWSPTCVHCTAPVIGMIYGSMKKAFTFFIHQIKCMLLTLFAHNSNVAPCATQGRSQIKKCDLVWANVC